MRFIVYWTWKMGEKPITKSFHIALQFAIKKIVLKNLHARVSFMVFILRMLELVPLEVYPGGKGSLNEFNVTRTRFVCGKKK